MVRLCFGGTSTNWVQVCGAGGEPFLDKRKKRFGGAQGIREETQVRGSNYDPPRA